MPSQDELLRQSAKDIVYDVLGCYKSVLPWFTGIYEDWTLGSLRINLINHELTFRSENFSQNDFNDICYRISNNIKRNLSSDYVVKFAQFNGEPGRLSVGNLIDAVVAITLEKDLEEIKQRESDKISSNYDRPNDIFSAIHQMVSYCSGSNYDSRNDTIYDTEPESLIELLCEENLLGFSEDESLMDSDSDERIEIIDKILQDDKIQWVVECQGLTYNISTDIKVIEIIEFAQVLD